MARKPKLVLGKDYIIDYDGHAVLTRDYLLSMGACCGNDCRYCPYQERPTNCPPPGDLRTAPPRQPAQRRS